METFRPDLFRDKVALITGGGTGIGLRIASDFVRLGGRVCIASRKLPILQKAVVVLNGLRPRQKDQEGTEATVAAIALECNVRSRSSVTNCVRECLKQLGSIHFLVNNAGGQFPSPAEAISENGWKAVIETNLNGTFFMSQEVFKSAFESAGGSIVNITCDMWQGFPFMSHTGAARAAVDNLTKTLAIEWSRCGVRVNSVAPGVVKSTGLKSYDDDTKQLIPLAARHNYASRFATEGEISHAVLYLLCPAAAYITGFTVRVDGGESLFHPLCPPTEHFRMSPFDDAVGGGGGGGGGSGGTSRELGTSSSSGASMSHAEGSSAMDQRWSTRLREKAGARRSRL